MSLFDSDVAILWLEDTPQTFNQGDKILVEGVGYFVAKIDIEGDVKPNLNSEFFYKAHGLEPEEPVNEIPGLYQNDQYYTWGEIAKDSNNQVYISRLYRNYANGLNDGTAWKRRFDLDQEATISPSTAENAIEYDKTKSYFAGTLVQKSYSEFATALKDVPPGVTPYLKNKDYWLLQTKEEGRPMISPIEYSNVLYNPDLPIRAGHNKIFDESGYAAIPINDSLGADLKDHRFFKRTSPVNPETEIDNLKREFNGSPVNAGELVDYNGFVFQALKDTDKPPVNKSPEYSLIKPSETPAETVTEPVITGESIVINRQGTIIGYRDLVSTWYGNFKSHVYSVKNRMIPRLHNVGELQSAHDNHLIFKLKFIINFKNLIKILDYIRIIGYTILRFTTIRYSSNFSNEQVVNDTHTERYKMIEGEHEVAAREREASGRIRGNYAEVTIEDAKTSQKQNIKINSVKHLSRNSH